MPALLPRALAVDRWRQSESVGVDFDMEQGSLIILVKCGLSSKPSISTKSSKVTFDYLYFLVGG